jgi:maltose-binding protein MalE
MTLDDSKEKLQALFRSGRAAYYTGSADELARLQAALGQEAVGVRPLPAGPEGSAGPFMRVEGFFLNAAGNLQLAAHLARYVAGEKSQKLLMENAGQVPANQQINTGSLPAISGFSIQAETAVPLPSVPEMAAVWEPGNDAYHKVLNGLTDPQAAAAEAARRINLANEAEPSVIDPSNGSAN